MSHVKLGFTSQYKDYSLPDFDGQSKITCADILEFEVVLRYCFGCWSAYKIKKAAFSKRAGSTINCRNVTISKKSNIWLIKIWIIEVCFYPTALKGCRGIVFTHGVRMGRRAVGKSLPGLYFRNRKV